MIKSLPSLAPSRYLTDSPLRAFTVQLLSRLYHYRPTPRVSRVVASESAAIGHLSDTTPTCRIFTYFRTGVSVARVSTFRIEFPLRHSTYTSQRMRRHRANELTPIRLHHSVVKSLGYTAHGIIGVAFRSWPRPVVASKYLTQPLPWRRDSFRRFHMS